MTLTALKPLGPLPSSVRAAQRTLDELWTQTDIETRAYTGNIVALTTPQHLARVQGALQGLQGRHAGRQLIAVIQGKGGAGGRMGVDVGLLPQGNFYIERLTLTASAEQLRGAILPLLRPATVNYVWWASDDAPGGALLRELTEIADQVIADSLRLDIPPARHYALADLSWSRSAAWREALAQMFDSRDAVAALRHVQHLTVWRAGNSERAARLFAGWVASKLGWSDLSNVTFLPGECEREHSDLCGLELSGEQVSFKIEADGQQLANATARFGKVSRQTSLMVPAMTLAEGLERVMARPERGGVFEDAWQLARSSLPAAALPTKDDL